MNIYYCSQISFIVLKGGTLLKFSKFNLIKKKKKTDNIILFNTLQGNCIEINEDIKKKIEENDIKNINKDTIKLFIQYGIIINDNVDENRIFSYFHDREKFSSNTLNSTVLLTWACNLKCIYCFEGEKENLISMTKENADKYINFITQVAKAKKVDNVTINLFGGEPMVNIEVGFYILKNIKEFCLKNNINFISTIITNGTLLNEENLSQLLELNCQSIQITLDGLQKMHDARRMDKNGKGTFDRIIDVLKLLNKKIGLLKSFNTVIRINVDKINIDGTYHLLEYIGKNGLNLTNCTVDFGIVRGLTESCAAYSNNCFLEEEIGNILYDLWNAAEQQGFYYNIRPMRRWMYCGLYSDNQYTVTPNCEVYKCWEHTGEKEHCIGKINEYGNLADIRFAFYDWMSHTPMDCKECRDCVYLPTCGGGCGMVSYAKMGTYHETGCFKIKGVIEKQLIKCYERNGQL